MCVCFLTDACMYAPSHKHTHAHTQRWLYSIKSQVVLYLNVHYVYLIRVLFPFPYSSMKTSLWTGHPELWRQTVYTGQRKYVVVVIYSFELCFCRQYLSLMLLVTLAFPILYSTQLIKFLFKLHRCIREKKYVYVGRLLKLGWISSNAWKREICNVSLALSALVHYNWHWYFCCAFASISCFYCNILLYCGDSLVYCEVKGWDCYVFH